MEHQLKTLTVGELRDILAEWPQDKKVAFSYPSGDHWHTQLIGTINTVESTQVEWTEYHRAFQVIADGEVVDEEPEDDASEEVLVLRQGFGKQ